MFNVEIRGVRPIIHHSGAGLNPKHPANIEKPDLTRKRGSNRTEADEARTAELECQLSLWMDGEGKPTIPSAALRSCIETAARKLKQGPQVGEGLIVSEVRDFFYDRERYGDTLEELAVSTQYRLGCSASASCGRGRSSTYPVAAGSPWTAMTDSLTSSNWRRGWTSRGSASAWETAGLRSRAAP